MKKTIITAAILLSAATAFCQASTPDTSKRLSFSMTEINQIQNTLQQAVSKIHQTHMDAMRRDSIDNMLGAVYNFMLKRETETYHPKAPVKKGGKEN